MEKIRAIVSGTRYYRRSLSEMRGFLILSIADSSSVCYINEAQSSAANEDHEMADKSAPVAKVETKVETKAEKFNRLAPPRIQNALDKIALIANLSAKGSYEYTPEQVAKIKTALDGAVSSALAGFAPDAKGPSATGFSF